MKKFKVTMNYEDTLKTGDHTITETWECKGPKKLKEVLCEALDLRMNENGPIEPNLEDVRHCLSPYADEQFIKEEFDRQSEMFKIYNMVFEDLTEDFSYSIDDNMRLTVHVFE